MNGNIGCFTGWHIPLALLAIVVLIMTILLIPLACLISLKQRIIRVSYWIIMNNFASPFCIHGIQKVYWLKYFENPLTVTYKEKWRWWSAMELARRFILILSVVSFPRNSVSTILICLVD